MTEPATLILICTVTALAVVAVAAFYDLKRVAIHDAIERLRTREANLWRPR